MADEKVGGGQYWLFIDPLGGTSYTNVVCLISHSFTMTNSTSSTTTYCGTSSVPGDKATSINLNGEVALNPSNGALSAPDLFDLANDQTTFSWQIARDTPIAGDYTLSGRGYFSSYTNDWTATDSAKFSGTITIDGDVTKVDETGS